MNGVWSEGLHHLSGDRIGLPDAMKADDRLGDIPSVYIGLGWRERARSRPPRSEPPRAPCELVHVGSAA